MYTELDLQQKSLQYRFWSKVNKNGPIQSHMDLPCWEWTAHCNVSGYPYGRFSVSGRLRLAHRVSWELHHNQLVPDKFDVLHKCDNPSCVNPEHLFLGTHQDNMRDMSNKGRVVAPRGEKNRQSKLTGAQVLEIKYKSTFTTQVQLGKEYGVSQAAIWYILNNRNWKYLE